MSFELGNRMWKLTFTDGRHGPSHFTVAAGDQAAVLERRGSLDARPEVRVSVNHEAAHTLPSSKRSVHTSSQRHEVLFS
jgi:hypothetical protein